MNQCEQQQHKKSCIRMKNNKKKTEIFMDKQMFLFFSFWEKTTTCGKVISIQCVFLLFLLLFFFILLLLLCQLFFLPSSFKVNLKVHNRNWRIFLLLVPMERRKKHTKITHKKSHKSAGQKQSASVSLRNKTTSKQFWIKTVWSILDSLRAL